jgi:Golgi phosphoprotein 3 (GPP34)
VPESLAIVCAMATLPEDLVILAVGAKPRGGPNNGKLPWRFCYGMRGAELVALTLAGRVEVTDGRIFVRDPAPLGDPNLDAALTGLAALRGVPVGEWMRDFPAGFIWSIPVTRTRPCAPGSQNSSARIRP